VNLRDADHVRLTPTSDGIRLPESVRSLVVGQSVQIITQANCDTAAAAEPFDCLYVWHVLQDLADYRGAILGWLGQTRIGGILAIEVPHAFLLEKALALPVEAFPGRRRLYTPASLLAEIEEALEPNTFRVRLLCDKDDGYDYSIGAGEQGNAAILIALERLPRPDWTLDSGEVAPAPPPGFSFEERRVRREVGELATPRKILILKLDHLGDFIIGLSAIERARMTFADAKISLVVGSWNEALARRGEYADEIIVFDAFPRNPTEEKIDLDERLAAFSIAVPNRYDIAIDLRTDHDTRPFLERVDASVRAGIGTKSQFPFLAIALPIDGSRSSERASTDLIAHTLQSCMKPARMTGNRIVCEPQTIEPGDNMPQVVVWGPYVWLQPGNYIFEPLLELDDDGQGMLLLDLAVETTTRTQAVAVAGHIPSLKFSVTKSSQFEFRIFRIGDTFPSFSFFGGRMRRRGAESVLHQSEYLVLLIELVAMRCQRFGLLKDRSESQ
jgi:hypothetical protein